MRTQRRARAISAGSCVEEERAAGALVDLLDEIEDLRGGHGI